MEVKPYHKGLSWHSIQNTSVIQRELCRIPIPWQMTLRIIDLKKMEQ